MPASSTLGDRPPAGTLGDRRFVARASLALLVANVRYWSTVAPIVRGELRRWEVRAQAIDDPKLRALALEKLRGEGFHAQAAAMLATLAPRSHRRAVTEAIVALELLYDYLDGLTERPSADPLSEGARLFESYTDALATASSDNASGNAKADGGGGNGNGKDFARLQEDGGYLHALSGAVRAVLRRLPATGAIAPVARTSATRSAQAQTRMHAASTLGTEQVEDWARSEAEGTDLGWRELLAGAASSVLAVQALIVAAADPRTTRAQAGQLESAYLRICTVLTLLDGLVDHDHDMRSIDAARPGYLSFYEDPDELSRRLIDTTRRAAAQTRTLPNGSHHAIVLVGVVAYYTSAPGARGELAAPIVKRLQAELAPLISPTLALMRGWRLVKGMGARNRRARRSGELASGSGKSRFIGRSRGDGGRSQGGGCNEI